MRYYKKILPRENNRRLSKLTSFRNDVVNYFNNCKFDRSEFEVNENEEARRTRIEINTALDEVHEIILAAGINPCLTYQAAPMRGGFITDLDVIMNIFNISSHQITPNIITDQVERAIGIYTKNRRAALFRFFNPFFYLGLIIDLLANLPFVLLGRIGFNRAKAESSLLGRIAKGFFQLVYLIAAVFAVLYYLGYMEAVKIFIRRYLK